MSMGYAAAHVDTVTHEFVSKICPEEYKEFIECLGKLGLSFEEFCGMNEYDFNPATDKLNTLTKKQLLELMRYWEQLQRAFERETEVGQSCLTLSTIDHDSNRGDIYDDLEAPSFTVEGVYKLTPAGEAFKDEITRKNFVQYG